jgi:transposase
VAPRDWAGPGLLAMILFEKYGQHQPLNRQAERYTREGVPLSLSTLADQVGACCRVLRPLHELLLTHVCAGRRVVARRRQDRAGAGDRPMLDLRTRRPAVRRPRTPPAGLFLYSRDRSGEHPGQNLATWSGILQADAYSAYSKLYEAERGARVLEAACWAHARRKFFELADIETAARRKAQRRTPPVISPMALEAVQRINVLFDIERSINCLPAAGRETTATGPRPRRCRPGTDRGMTVREIQGHLRELYAVDVSPDLISRVTDAVLDEVRRSCLRRTIRRTFRRTRSFDPMFSTLLEAGCPS